MAVRGAILCGGEGKRLSPLTNYFQKTMVPIGPRKKPLLEYVVRLLVYHKIKNITMLTGYRAEEIENYFDDGSRFEASINYSKDPVQASGSAGALASAISRGKIRKDEDVVIYYGDILSNINLSEMLNVHRSSKVDATLVLSKGYTLPVGVAEVRENKVVSLIEKPKYDINVTIGNMVLGGNAIKILTKMVKKGSQVDLMRNFVPELLHSRIKVGAYYVKTFWYDVGTVDKYLGLDDKTVEKHLGFLGH
ncbi:MAG: nucleotidyltransferase family protein [Nitrososphaerota archaeon]|nr:nucleotidyltransferase family protein [Nitrososphaerota archaeon]